MAKRGQPTDADTLGNSSIDEPASEPALHGPAMSKAPRAYKSDLFDAFLAGWRGCLQNIDGDDATIDVEESVALHMAWNEWIQTL
jgi:hypothetical protein